MTYKVSSGTLSLYSLNPLLVVYKRCMLLFLYTFVDVVMHLTLYADLVSCWYLLSVLCMLVSKWCPAYIDSVLDTLLSMEDLVSTQ